MDFHVELPFEFTQFVYTIAIGAVLTAVLAAIINIYLPRRIPTELRWIVGFAILGGCLFLSWKISPFIL